MPVKVQEPEVPLTHGKSAPVGELAEKAEHSSHAGNTSDPAERSSETLVCGISIHSTDKLRLIGMPDHYWEELRKTVERAWPRGIQREKWVDAAREVKFVGDPWEGEGEDSIQARRLVVALIRFLERRGWALECASCFNRKSSAKDTLLFRRLCDEEARGPVAADSEEKEPDICAVSFNMNDRVRVIDVPASVADVVKGVIQREWREGMEKERWFNGVPEYKLNGNPWNSEGDETVQANLLVGRIVRALREVGWKVHASVGITNCKEGRDLDTWILKKVSS